MSQQIKESAPELVLKIFFEISNVMKKEGIILDLYKFQGNTEIEYKPEM